VTARAPPRMAAAERIANWGNGGGSGEKKLKKKKWGRKRWSGFGQGILDRIGARGAGGFAYWFKMDGAVRQLLGRVVRVGLVGSAGWRAGWLGAFPIEDAPMCSIYL
jgi:hypothetical protein